MSATIHTLAFQNEKRSASWSCLEKFACVVIFPNVLFFRDGAPLSLLDAAAPVATINILAWSLIIGAMLFLPILYYLIRVFKVTK